jgi:hypothetical protein
MALAQTLLCLVVSYNTMSEQKGNFPCKLLNFQIIVNFSRWMDLDYMHERVYDFLCHRFCNLTLDHLH